MAGLDVDLATLPGLAGHDLQIAWRRLYRSEPPAGLSRDLMVRALAYRMQERAEGGLSPGVKRGLHALVEAFADKSKGGFDPSPSLKPGARLVRQWRGEAHTVTVLKCGYEYAGKRHRSLTEIARLITGAHRSGPLFFGIRTPRANANGNAGDE